MKANAQFLHVVCEEMPSSRGVTMAQSTDAERTSGPGAYFLWRRRSHAQAFARYLSNATVVVLVETNPKTTAGYLSAAGIDGLLQSTGRDVRRTSLRRIKHGTTAGDLLVVPPPLALGSTDAGEVAVALLRASRCFDRVLLVGWTSPSPPGPLIELLSQKNVFVTVSDVATFASLKSHGQIELDVDPAIYFQGFSPSLRDGAWHKAFDGVANEGSRGSRSIILLGDEPLVSSPDETFGRQLADIATSDNVVTDRWHILLSALLLGRHVEYLDDHTGHLGSLLRYHFGGAAGTLASVSDSTWLDRSGGLAEDNS